MKSHLLHVAKGVPRNQGFSLLELMVAMAILLLVSASAFILFSHQQTNANQQQGLVGLNIGIRNAIAQLQLDLANAGTGYYVGRQHSELAGRRHHRQQCAPGKARPVTTPRPTPTPLTASISLISLLRRLPPPLPPPLTPRTAPEERAGR